MTTIQQGYQEAIQANGLFDFASYQTDHIVVSVCTIALLVTGLFAVLSMMQRKSAAVWSVASLLIIFGMMYLSSENGYNAEGAAVYKAELEKTYMKELPIQEATVHEYRLASNALTRTDVPAELVVTIDGLKQWLEIPVDVVAGDVKMPTLTYRFLPETLGEGIANKEHQIAAGYYDAVLTVPSEEKGDDAP